MSEYVPTKQHLREILLFYYNSKKSAAEAHRMLVEAYGDAALGETACRHWYQRFKSGDFDTTDKERSGQPKKFDDDELMALLNEDPCQTTTQLAESLGVSHPAISRRLNTLGMVQKQGKWVPNK